MPIELEKVDLGFTKLDHQDDSESDVVVIHISVYIVYWELLRLV